MPDEPEDETTEARFRRVREELRAMELPHVSDEEIDARLGDSEKRARPSVPDLPDVDDLELRTRRARLSHDRAKGEEGGRLADDAKASKGLGIGLSIAYTLLGLPMVGLGVGFLLDRLLGTTAWKGIGTVAGAVGGIAFAVMILNRENSRL